MYEEPEAQTEKKETGDAEVRTCAPHHHVSSGARRATTYYIFAFFVFALFYVIQVKCQKI